MGKSHEIHLVLVAKGAIWKIHSFSAEHRILWYCHGSFGVVCVHRNFFGFVLKTQLVKAVRGFENLYITEALQCKLKIFHSHYWNIRRPNFFSAPVRLLLFQPKAFCAHEGHMHSSEVVRPHVCFYVFSWSPLCQ